MPLYDFCDTLKKFFFPGARWWSGQSANQLLLRTLQPSAESQPLKSIHSVHSVHLRRVTLLRLFSLFSPGVSFSSIFLSGTQRLATDDYTNSGPKSNKCRKVPHILVLYFMAFPISVTLMQTVAPLSSVAKLVNLKQANKKVLAQSPLKLDFWNNFFLVFH